MQLIVEPGKVCGWEDFCCNYPSKAVALDGYVNCGPCFDPSGPRVNFNHHEGVSRLETRATCAQVLLAIRQGLMDCLGSGDQSEVKIFVNDCDQDVCLSVFLLRHSYMVKATMNPLINQLVFMEDMIDTTAAAYPFPADLPSFSKLMWVFEPYHIFRDDGGLNRKDAHEYANIISDVERRIMSFITGSAGSVKLDIGYSVLHAGNGWNLVKEEGRHARVGMYANGIQAFVSVVNLPDGRYRYTVGRVSQFIPFDVPKILEALNEAEGIASDDRDCWGGGNTIGGSPRLKGSTLSPEQIKVILDKVVGNHQQ